MSDLLDKSLNQSQVVQFTATAKETGLRLDQMLVSQLPTKTRSQIQRWIKEGLAEINGKRGRASTVVHIGDCVLLQIPSPTPTTPKPENLPLSIVYDDQDLIIVDKPSGMVVHPSAGHFQGTLVNALLHHVKDLSGVGGELRPGIVHRLDRGTSGLMVIAKHDQAHNTLARQFAYREVKKVYKALVWGIVQANQKIDVPIGRDPVHRKKFSTRSHRTKDAVTRVTKAEHLGWVSLVEVMIATGRTHQIRVHLNSIGHAVVGDSVYGSKRQHSPSQLKILKTLERPFLHASKLSFHHPRTGREINFTSLLPVNLQTTLDEIRTAHRNA